MSGICGVLTKRPPGRYDRTKLHAGSPTRLLFLLQQMMAALRHRGPNDVGFLLAGGPGTRAEPGTHAAGVGGGGGRRRLHVCGMQDLSFGLALVGDPEVCMGIRQLSIVDLDGGHQPVGNEEGNIGVVFDGEIANRRELRRDLEREGHRFATATDAEILVHAYEEYGDGCVQRAHGAFAFALWDDRRGALLLARDPVGARPLFTAEVGDRFLFASEIKAILRDPEFRRVVDQEALYHYLTYGHVPPPLTIFQGVRALPPGHLMVWRGGEFEVREYWEGPRSMVGEARAAAVSPWEAWGLFQNSVYRRLASDLPGRTSGCGVLLDGGSGSAAVAATTQEVFGGSTPTFAIGLTGSDPSLRRARRTAQFLRTDHHEVRLDADSAALLPRVAWHLDQPLADPRALAHFALYRAARQEITVALTGAGAGLFDCGLRIADCGLRNGRGKIGPPIRNPQSGTARSVVIRNRLCPVDRATLLGPALVGGEDLLFFGGDKRRLFVQDRDDRFPSSLGLGTELFERVGRRDVFCQAAYLELKGGLSGRDLLLHDRMGMAFGLATRAPFLDLALLECIGCVPLPASGTSRSGASLWAEAIHGRFPRCLTALPVVGTPAIDAWLRRSDGGLAEAMTAALAPEVVRRRGYFREEAVAQMVTARSRGRSEYDRHLWALFMLELWHRVHLDGDFSPRADLTLADLGLGGPRPGRVLWHNPVPEQPAPGSRLQAPGSTPQVTDGQALGLSSAALCASTEPGASSTRHCCADRPASASRGEARPDGPLSLLLTTVEDPAAVRCASARLLPEWATRLAARGAAVTVLTSTEESGPPVREVRAGVTYLRGRPTHLLRGAPPFHVVGIHHPRAGQELGHALNRGVPRVYAFLTPLSEEYRERAGEAELPVRSATLRALDEYERRVVRSCGTVVTASGYSLQEVIRLHGIPSDHVQAIPAGVDVERFRPRSDRRALRREYGLAESGFLLLAVQSLTPGSGVDRLITAMAGVTEAYPEAHLVLVGEGSMEPALRRQVAEQGLGRTVTFAGVVPEIVLPEYYALADLCVLPRVQPDRDGLVAIEALACGTPLVATPVGALPEILRPLDPGALLADDTAGAITDGIIRRLPEVHHDDALRRRCRRYAEQNYAWDAVVPALEALLHDAATRRRPDSRPQLHAPQSPALRVARGLLRPRACAD